MSPASPQHELLAERARLLRLRERLGHMRTELRARPSLGRLRSIESELDAAVGGSPRLQRAIHGAQRRHALGRVRRLVLLLVVLAAFVELAGVPHLRMSYSPSAGRYLSVTGWRVVEAGRFGEGTPLVVLIPLDKSLVQHGRELLGSAWSHVHPSIQEAMPWN